MIKNKRILVCGGGGSIGSELVRQLAPHNRIFILDLEETNTFDLVGELRQEGRKVHYRIGDITDKDTVQDVFSDFKPQIVINAAARKHVTPNEIYPLEAIKVNVIGTYNLLHYSKIYDVDKFVFISTDKAVNPTSVMGISKKMGEVMTVNRGYIAVRFGNVLGSRGSVIPIWQKQIDKGKPVTITHPEMERYFMTIEEACQLVIRAAEMGRGKELFILDMGKQIKVEDLAKQIINKSHREIPIEYIGVRDGEAMEEQLMTEEEKIRAIKKDRFFIIK